MLEFLDIGLPDAVAYRIDGKVSTDEMKACLDRFRKRIEQGEKICLYQEIQGLGGVEMEALKEKLKFFIANGIKGFQRVAVVSEAKWITRLIELEGRLLPGVEMKGFPKEQKEEAIAFLKGPASL